jgi:predicted DNA-binding protein (MmcQ/YjbR family)
MVDRIDASAGLTREVVMPKQKPGIAAQLAEFALSLPGAHEDFPWGERVAKVNKKVFAFLGKPDSTSFGVKLPQSGEQARELPFVAPAGYGLAKAGWVQVDISGKDLPVDLFLSWIEESYRAVAPKKLVKELDAAKS